jgi:rubrerythrin
MKIKKIIKASDIVCVWKCNMCGAVHESKIPDQIKDVGNFGYCSECGDKRTLELIETYIMEEDEKPTHE